MDIPRLASQGHQVLLRTIRVLFACGGMVVLSAVCASAGSRSTGVVPQGMSLNGMGQNGVGTSDAFTGTAQAVAAPPAGLSSAPPRQVALADPDLAATALKREQLTYLARCALSEGVEVYTQQAADRFTFPGRIGLAPRWLAEAMTPREERWVSACISAHVNYFGKQVKPRHNFVSVRGEGSRPC